MITFVLDASAVLRFTDKEPGFRRVRDVLKLGATGQAELLMSAVNWAELLHALQRRTQQRPEFDWKSFAASLESVPITIVPADAHLAVAAAELKTNFQLALADSFAGALALSSSPASGRPVTLLTADFDFKTIPVGKIKIEFLPAK